MQRFFLTLLRGSYAGCVAYRAVPGTQSSSVIVVAYRASSSSIPPPHGSSEPTRLPHEPSAAGAAPASAKLDTEAAEQLRIVEELGEQAFGENTEILKKVAFHGLRSLVVCAVGMIALILAMKKKRQELEAVAPSAVAGGQAQDDDDPTKRYLQEMRELGFDVDTLEEELEQERLAKPVASHSRIEV